jgi:hypothetical protein
LTIYKYEYKNIFYDKCPEGTYNNNFKCIDCDEKCSSCSKESAEQNLCLSCNNSNKYYEKYNNIFQPNSSFKDCFRSPNGFYLDNDLFYKPCYTSCASCDKNGNEDRHNCTECKQGNKYKLELNGYLNCYSECQNYYYIEENISGNKYKCTSDLECPNNYKKLIENLRRCIDKCEKDDKYKYEFRNKCY